MGGAAVLQYMEMPQGRRDAGRGAVLLHQEMERRAVDRPLLFAQEDRPGEAAAHFQPGAERPGFFAHQVVVAGRPAKLTPQTSARAGLSVLVRMFQNAPSGNAPSGVSLCIRPTFP